MLAIYISPPGHQSKKEEATEKSASVTNIIMNLEKERHVATTGTAPIFSPHLKCIDGKEEKSFLQFNSLKLVLKARFSHCGNYFIFESHFGI